MSEGKDVGELMMAPLAVAHRFELTVRSCDLDGGKALCRHLPVSLKLSWSARLAVTSPRGATMGSVAAGCYISVSGQYDDLSAASLRIKCPPEDYPDYNCNVQLAQ